MEGVAVWRVWLYGGCGYIEGVSVHAYLCGDMRLTTCIGLVTGIGLPAGLGRSRVCRESPSIACCDCQTPNTKLTHKLKYRSMHVYITVSQSEGFFNKLWQ